MTVRRLDAWYGDVQVVKDVSMEIPARQVTAVIGPSGCGKSTFIRCLNRMHEFVAGARMQGKVALEGVDIYAADIDPVLVRRRIGMVFQKGAALFVRRGGQ
jgi:phosphate transport system ATP-binding protein